MQMPSGPLCQSCAMPMEKPGNFGTNADGSSSTEFCALCFQGGAFTDPDVTMKQMIDRVTGIMVERMNMPEPQARGIGAMFIPTLKRWRSS